MCALIKESQGKEMVIFPYVNDGGFLAVKNFIQLGKQFLIITNHTVFRNRVD